MIFLKSGRDLEAMRQACAVANTVLDDVCQWVKPGVTTREVDQYAAEIIKSYGAKSAFLGYQKYPCHACLSVNEQVVHGLAGDLVLQYGDLLSIDVGVVLKGFIGDNARTIPIGGCDLENQKLMDVTKSALYEGIAKAVVGNRVVDISTAIQNFVETNNFGVVREFVGHGVGRSMHEEPQVPNYVDGKSSPKLRAGMTLAIEPMVNMGSPEVKVLKDGWTVVTKDGLPSAHFEHTILITESKPEILTCREKMALN
ncbi:MAG TPA: type I methionyl aminopeptidase [Verrucomicrobiales bacterium]|nr:type I methionyl aminopeptidase [Verrucomicrobiales bacterium]HIL68739.1 type I methionyl aminopeptidase [Verrucomicrobiota bacterium]